MGRRFLGSCVCHPQSLNEMHSWKLQQTGTKVDIFDSAGKQPLGQPSQGTWWILYPLGSLDGDWKVILEDML